MCSSSTTVVQLTFVILDKQANFCVVAIIDRVWKRPVVISLDYSVTRYTSNMRSMQVYALTV